MFPPRGGKQQSVVVASNRRTIEQDIKFSTQLRQGNANYNLYCNLLRTYVRIVGKNQGL